MADQVGAYTDNGQPAYFIEAGTNKPYTFKTVNGQVDRSKKLYLPPQAIDPYSTDRGGQDGNSFFKGRAQWDTGTGDWQRPTNWGNIGALGVGAAMGAPWLAGAVGGGGGGAAASMPALSAPSSVLPAASGMIGAPAAAASAAAPAAAAASMPALSAPASVLPTGTMPASKSILSSVLGFGKKNAASLISGGVNSYLDNRRTKAQKDIADQRTALDESTLNPYRSLMFQSADANKLDYQANADFSSAPTQIAGRYGDAAGPAESNFTWNPSPETRGLSQAALAMILAGKGQNPTMTNRSNYGQTPAVSNAPPYTPSLVANKRPARRNPWLEEDPYGA